MMLIGLALYCGPAPRLLCGYLVLLLQLGDHNDDRRLLLPRHLPEVIHSVDHGTLSGDERLVVAEVTLRQEPIRTQGHTLLT